MLMIPCCLVVGLGSGLVFGLLVVMHAYILKI